MSVCHYAKDSDYGSLEVTKVQSSGFRVQGSGRTPRSYWNLNAEHRTLMCRIFAPEAENLSELLSEVTGFCKFPK
jgi:hypothetical protein